MTRFKDSALIVGVVFVGALLWLALRAGPITSAIDLLSNFTAIFLGIFIEASSFLLLGTLASGLVEVFVNQNDIARFIPRDPLRGALVGAVMGIYP